MQYAMLHRKHLECCRSPAFHFSIFFNQGKEQQRRQSAGPSSSGESEASGVETRFFVDILGAG